MPGNGSSGSVPTSWPSCARADEARRARGAPDYGSPCLWFDAGSGRCRHYEYRPRACDEFELGGRDCRDARRRAGVDSGITPDREPSGLKP